jgi:hypothetical protein
MAQLEHGLAQLTSRDVGENSDKRVVQTVGGSGFIAAIKPAAEEIFSAQFPLTGR